jgi:hypothetical protein
MEMGMGGDFMVLVVHRANLFLMGGGGHLQSRARITKHFALVASWWLPLIFYLNCDGFIKEKAYNIIPVNERESSCNLHTYSCMF